MQMVGTQWYGVEFPMHICTLGFFYHLTQQKEQTRILGLKGDGYSVYKD